MSGLNPTRRELLRKSAVLGVAGIGLGSAGTAAADPVAAGDFGRVWANGVLWRTNVVNDLDEEPEPSDAIYFINDGTTASLPPNGGSTAVALPSSRSQRRAIETGTVASGCTSALNSPTV